MDKYYKQISEVQDWVNSVKERIADSFKMTEALSAHF